MPACTKEQDPKGRVLVLSPDCDATQLKLSAAEGYLLSRIDGQTPWRHLREMGGIPADEVDGCLERWLSEGILDVVGGAPKPDASASAKSDTASPDPSAPSPPRVAEIDEQAIDAALDLGVEVQRRILEFEASLDLPYHDLLRVPRGSEPKVVKRAYFKLSKEFHPDRYFRREIGDYGARLERIFKKVLEAHEILSDPELCQVENQAAPTDSPGEAVEQVVDAVLESAAPATPAAPKPASKPRELTKLERLKQRMPFKIDHAAIAARRAKADEIFRAACTSQQAGRLGEAEASIRIAISFDPTRAEFKEALGALRIEAAGDRAAKLLAKPSERMSDTEMREALHLIEDVLLYRPHDPELNDRAARICLKLGRLGDAVEYVETLIEGSPEVASHHTLLGKIHRDQGDLDAALRCFETALKHDKNDLEAQRAFAAVRIGHRDAVRGEGA